MTTVLFLAEWALRSSILILCGALLLRVFRVKDPALKLAAWVAMLGASLAIPVLHTVLPAVPLMQARLRSFPPLTMRATQELEGRLQVQGAVPAVVRQAVTNRAAAQDKPRQASEFNWATLAIALYAAVAGALLLRLGIGLLLSMRLLRASRATGREAAGGIAIRESDVVAAPVTLGIVRSVIVVPKDWREWSETKLDAVVSHELSHIQRKDPAVQLVSAIHRALVWHSPLSWLMHQQIVRVAEEASDDAALAVTGDRASYAEVLLDFMQRGVRNSNWNDRNLQGVAMARYKQPAERISRILDGVSRSRGLTRWGVLAIVACASPLTYLLAAAQTRPEPPEVVAPVAPEAPVAPAAPGVAPPALAPAAPLQPAEAPPAVAPVAALGTPNPPPALEAPQAPAPHSGRSIRRYMIVSGDSTTGSWSSDDDVDREALRKKYGNHFAWFWQGHNDYVVTDAGVLAELDAAMAPQQEVNGKQSEVNKLQEAVNQRQEAVNRAQNEVNTIQEGANRRQELINELQSAQGNEELIKKVEKLLAELRTNKNAVSDQEAVNRAQSKVNELQERVNEAQSKVSEQQEKVSKEQERVSEKFNGRIEAILESAVQRHLAQELK